jgi:signal-transduction protein with cAMP-binding, CBS, and nucleotidyltransferase domain
MHVGEICTRSVVTCSRGTSAREVAQLMSERHVGDVIVVDMQPDGSVPVGVVTDRDLAVSVIARGRDPDAVRAGELMNERLVTAVQTEGVYDAIWHMRSKGIRRLPVVDGHNRLLGVLTADDVTRFLADELSAVACIAPQQTQLEQARLRARHSKETTR